MTSFNIQQKTLSNLSLKLLYKNFQQLHNINLTNIKSITKNKLINLTKNLHHLNFINLN